MGRCARRLVVVVCALVAMLCAAPVARAHPGLKSSAIVSIKADGTLIVSVHHDALAFALNDISERVEDEPMNALLDGPPADLAAALVESRERFQTLMRVEAEGVPVALTITEAPTPEKVGEWVKSGYSPRLPVKMDFVTRGALPVSAKSVVFFFPEILSSVVVTIERPGQEPATMVAQGGHASPEVPIALRASVVGGAPEAGAVHPSAAAQTPGAAAPEPAATEPAPTEPAQPAPVQTDAAPIVLNPMGFIILGFEHILPDGLDHILFVLGLFLLNAKLKPLLIQITCFTLAHSVTLALAARGWVSVPGSIVEPIIAASIAFVAIENIFTTKVSPWRPALIFVFGLIHGLGFAGAFQEAVHAETIPLGPVMLFNVGVELGQLAVVGIAFVLVGWAINKPWYRARISIPASALIAAVGLWWTFERVFLQ